MKFIDADTRPRDPWRSLEGDDGPVVTLTPGPNLLLTLYQWHSARAQWPEGLAVGLKLDNDAKINEIAADLPRFALVALQFPKWTDGRAYSQAHLLRTRHRFAGEVRALGDVLVDMLPLLQRTGFDAVVMRADQSRDAAERALGFFPGHYQGDTLDPLPLFAKPPGTAEALAHPPAKEFVGLGDSI
jgi:uncharacterized protein (DUF934 family)